VRRRERLHRGGHVPTANALICVVTTAVYQALNGAKSDMAFGRLTRFAKVWRGLAFLATVPAYIDDAGDQAAYGPCGRPEPQFQEGKLHV